MLHVVSFLFLGVPSAALSAQSQVTPLLTSIVAGTLEGRAWGGRRGSTL